MGQNQFPVLGFHIQFPATPRPLDGNKNPSDPRSSLSGMGFDATRAKGDVLGATRSALGPGIAVNGRDLGIRPQAMGLRY